MTSPNPPILPSEAPVAFLDSGFGGLDVASHFSQLLPSENIIYIADTANLPFGDKSLNEVRRLSLRGLEYLVEVHRPKLVVLACNTATAALSPLVAFRGIPILGVIATGLDALAAQVPSGIVGVVGTQATIASGAYQRLAERLHPSLDLIACACPGLVDLVEQEGVDVDLARRSLSASLRPLWEAPIDAVLLGCTHYAFVVSELRRALPAGTPIISASPAVALRAKAVLVNAGTLRENHNEATRSVFCTGDPIRFRRLAALYLPDRFAVKHLPSDWESYEASPASSSVTEYLNG